MSKLSLSRRITSNYSRQTIFDILRDIENLANRGVDGFLFPTTPVTADYTPSIYDSFIPVNATSAAVTITLRVASETKGKRMTIKKTDSTGNAVTIDGSGSETIDDALTQIITSQYDSICLLSDGTEWWIV